MTRQAIAVWEDEFAKKLEVDIFANSADFEVPIYNVWKQQTKTRKQLLICGWPVIRKRRLRTVWKCRQGHCQDGKGNFLKNAMIIIQEISLILTRRFTGIVGSLAQICANLSAYFFRPALLPW